MTEVFFRNDDVAVPEAGLVEMTGLLLERGAKVSHAVEPGNLTPEIASWLLDHVGRGVEIIQHGFKHAVHDRGEFGGNRPRADQERDLREGLRILDEAFGDRWLRCMSFPFGLYNADTMSLLDELAYPLVSCHWRHQLSRRLFYVVGRTLRRGKLLDRHIPWHLKRYPGTHLREISVTISPIASYHLDEGPLCCRFRDLPTLQAQFEICRRQTPVVGVVLHHKYHDTPEKLQVLADLTDWLAAQDDVRFTTIEDVARGL